MIKDMTYGKPLKLILLFSIPLFIGNIFQQLYNIVDMVVVGQFISTDALAALGSVAPIYFLMFFIFIGLTNGFSIITGQRFGANDIDGVKRSYAVSTALSFIITIVFSLFIIIFLKIILKLLNVPDNIFQDAYDYTWICAAGLVLTTAYNLVSSVVRALGDSKTPLYFLIVASVLNALLAALFTIKFNWGVPGTAWAVNISEFFACVCCYFFVNKNFPILRLRKRDWLFLRRPKKRDWDFIVEHLKIGLPMAFQLAIVGFSIIIIQGVCNSYGADVIAGFTVAIRVEQLVLLPMASLGVALSAYVAQNFGANYFSRIRKGVLKTSLINVIFSLCVAVLVYFNGSHIAKIFLGNPRQEILDIAKNSLMISTMFYIFLGQLYIYKNALQGMSKVKIPLISSIVELFLRIYICVVLTEKLGYIGVFWAGPLSWCIVFLMLFIGYLKSIRQIVYQYKRKRRIK